MAEKKVPLRRCAGCNEQKSKKEFVRVVRTPEGEILLDESGKANGRGVYLCPKKACLQKARKAKRLERNLDVAIPDEIWAQLEAKLEQ
ncbi:MAG: YlxR family protein [Ruminococcaceae bacterium]|nr:YlxR family protein [Oscillospiraceae bacterium]